MKNKKAILKKKYRTLELLKKLPYEEYVIAKRKLPIALGVSKRTFERWMYLDIDSKVEMSVDKLVIIAKYLNVNLIDELMNYEIPTFNTAKLKKLKESNDLIDELNLTL